MIGFGLFFKGEIKIYFSIIIGRKAMSFLLLCASLVYIASGLGLHLGGCEFA
jgi:hypothetical protein